MLVAIFIGSWTAIIGQYSAFENEHARMNQVHSTVFDHPLEEVRRDLTIDVIVMSEIISRAEKSGVDARLALEIARAESEYRPHAKNLNANGTWDKGVFQINDVHGVSDECRLSYVCNIDWAIHELAINGPGAWSASRHKWQQYVNL